MVVCRELSDAEADRIFRALADTTGRDIIRRTLVGETSVSGLASAYDMSPHRAVTTERMIGMPGDETVNELTLTPVADGTLLALLITYPNKELRDIVLATGMTDGMETSYLRLESILA